MNCNCIVEEKVYTIGFLMTSECLYSKQSTFIYATSLHVIGPWLLFIFDFFILTFNKLFTIAHAGSIYAN